jgi:hypothetical protein
LAKRIVEPTTQRSQALESQARITKLTYDDMLQQLWKNARLIMNRCILGIRLRITGTSWHHSGLEVSKRLAAHPNHHNA